MKIINLLNKIANGEEVPKMIKYKGDIYIWGNTSKKYYEQERNYVYVSFDTYELNDEIEIIEEVEDKEYEDIEEITIREKTIGFPNGEWTARNMDKAFSHKINALIRNQKKIIERLDNDK